MDNRSEQKKEGIRKRETQHDEAQSSEALFFLCFPLVSILSWLSQLNHPTHPIKNSHSSSASKCGTAMKAPRSSISSAFRQVRMPTVLSPAACAEASPLKESSKAMHSAAVSPMRSSPIYMCLWVGVVLGVGLDEWACVRVGQSRRSTPCSHTHMQKKITRTFQVGVRVGLRPLACARVWVWVSISQHDIQSVLTFYMCANLVTHTPRR